MSYILICHFEHHDYKDTRYYDDVILHYTTKELANEVRNIIHKLEVLYCEDIKVFPHLTNDIEKYGLNTLIEYMFGSYMCHHMEFKIHYVPPIIR